MKDLKKYQDLDLILKIVDQESSSPEVGVTHERLLELLKEVDIESVEKKISFLVEKKEIHIYEYEGVPSYCISLPSDENLGAGGYERRYREAVKVIEQDRLEREAAKRKLETEKLTLELLRKQLDGFDDRMKKLEEFHESTISKNKVQFYTNIIAIVISFLALIVSTQAYWSGFF